MEGGPNWPAVTFIIGIIYYTCNKIKSDRSSLAGALVKAAPRRDYLS